MLYPLIRNILFGFDAEAVHYFAMNSLKKGCSIAPVKKLLQSSFQFNHPNLQKTVFGLPFKNPVGLGGGF